MATDPVCAMTVEREGAVSAERDGETFWFCSRGCRDESLRAPSPAGQSGSEVPRPNRLVTAIPARRPRPAKRRAGR